MAGKIRKSNLHNDVKTMVTDMISEQALDSANFDSVLASKTTDDITEGSTNQYYTSTRADSDFDIRLATKTTGDISEGSNLYYTTSRADSDFDVRLATKTTDNLTEGSNQYYTDARADARIAAASLTDISDADQTVRTTDNVTFADLTLTGSLIGPSTMYVDPAPVDSDAGLLVIRGDLQVDGTTTTVNSTTVSINDKNIVLADSAANASEADGAGITVNGASATITYDAANDEWDFNKDINVTGTISSTQLINSGGTGTELAIVNDKAGGIGYYADNNGHTFKTYVGGWQTRLVVEEDGNVGIGTNSPSRILTIRNTGGAFSSTNNPAIRLDNTSTGRFGLWEVDSDQNMNIWNGDTGSGNIRFYRGGGSGTHTMTIGGNGAIGIGTTEPLLYGSGVPTLHFQGTADNSRGGAIRFHEYDGTQTGAIYSTDGTDGYGGITLHSAQGPMKFSVGTLQSYRMAIDTSGRVGIGTTVPAGRFEVVGSQSLNWAGRFENTHGNGYGVLAVVAGTEAADKVFELRTGTTSTVMLVDGTGNVGIGTNSPDTILHISSAGSPQIRVQDTTNDVRGQFTANDSNVVIGTVSNHSLNFATNNGNQVTLAGSNLYPTNNNTSQLGLSNRVWNKIWTTDLVVNSNVGIGTNSPSAPLEVHHASVPVLRVKATSSSGQASLYLDGYTDGGSTNRASRINFRKDTFTEWSIINDYDQNDNNKLDFEYVGSRKVTFTGDGDVGIGTAFPQKRLDVVYGQLAVRSETASSGGTGDSDAVNDLIHLRMPYGTSPGSTNNAGARVGIKFTGRNDGNGYTDDGGKSASIYGVSEDTGAGYSRKMGMSFYTSAFDASQVERMRISNDGHVGIGTTNPRMDPNGGFAWAVPATTIYGSRPTLYLNSTGNISTIRLWPNGSSSTNDDWHINAVATNSGGFLTFAPRAGSIAPSSLHIKNNGNVGIGVTTPEKQLQVRETSSSTSGTFLPISVGGRSHVTGYAAGIGFDPEGYGYRNKMAIVAEGINQGWSRGKFHFLLENTTGSSNEATLSDSKMVITDSGYVGIGTTQPADMLDVYGADNGITIRSASSDRPKLKFINGTSTMLDISANSTIVDIGGAGSSVPYFTLIKSTDEIMIGPKTGDKTAISTDSVHAMGQVNRATLNSNTGRLARLVMQERQGNWISFCDGSSAHYGTIARSGSGVSYGSNSDYRLKENINDLSSGIDKVKALRPVTFSWIADSDSTVITGFLAHEVKDVIDEAVDGEKDGYSISGNIVDADDNIIQYNVPSDTSLDSDQTFVQTSSTPKYQQLDPAKLVPVLTQALKEAINKIEQLESRLDSAGL